MNGRNEKPLPKPPPADPLPVETWFRVRVPGPPSGCTARVCVPGSSIRESRRDGIRGAPRGRMRQRPPSADSSPSFPGVVVAPNAESSGNGQRVRRGRIGFHLQHPQPLTVQAIVHMTTLHFPDFPESRGREESRPFYWTDPKRSGSRSNRQFTPVPRQCMTGSIRSAGSRSPRTESPNLTPIGHRHVFQVVRRTPLHPACLSKARDRAAWAPCLRMTRSRALQRRRSHPCRASLRSPEEQVIELALSNLQPQAARVRAGLDSLRPAPTSTSASGITSPRFR